MGKATLHKAHATKLPIEDETVQVVTTSPPYFRLRRYDGVQDGIWNGDEKCKHDWDESGTKEVVASSRMGNVNKKRTEKGLMDETFQDTCATCKKCGAWRGAYGREPDVKLYVEHSIQILSELKRVLRKDGTVFWNVGDSYDDKVLQMVPARVALAAKKDGWFLRSDIIWAKIGPQPESVKDRPTYSHEHIFMFTKTKDNYWDDEAVRVKDYAKTNVDASHRLYDVWHIPTRTAKGKGNHFAAFNDQIPRYGIMAASSAHGACARCHTPYVRGEKNEEGKWDWSKGCTCKTKDVVPCVVLDPFCGSGTTGRVALELGRDFIGTDLHYQDLAKKQLATIEEKSTWGALF